MKSNITVLIILGCFTYSVWAELISTNLVNGPVVNEGVNIYRRRGVTNILNLPQGKQLVIHGVNVFPAKENNGYAWGFVQTRSTTNNQLGGVGIISCSGINRYNNWNGPILGPKRIEYGLFEAGWSVPEFGQTTGAFLFEIKDISFQSGASTLDQVSSTSVVVPSAADANVDVLLEQSSDLITWTQCLPGTYQASTEKRFFRVRAIEK